LKGKNMIGRPAAPDEYKGVILFLASEASKFITASNLVADGGQTAW
jgi:NAD(P)-dependent dehydrogenase (short-subunit alcohol dehydrogenase family)